MKRWQGHVAIAVFSVAIVLLSWALADGGIVGGYVALAIVLLVIGYVAVSLMRSRG
jgi:hypothetical protein